MPYTEDKFAANGYKQTYRDGLLRLIEQRQQAGEETRKQYTQAIFTDPEPYRRRFREMLGWPLTEPRDAAPPAAECELLAEEDGYRLYRMSFEILPGLKMYGLLYRAEGTQPLVLVQHGGHGTPEFIGGLYGDDGNYNRMLERVKQYGVHIFAPQLLLWHPDYEVEFDRVGIDAQLKRVGSSITAVEIHGLQRILDYFEGQDFVSCFGMVGLSYGGFYTLFTAALDTRIRSAVSCAFFNDRDKVPSCDWSWWQAAELLNDAEIACLVYPRRLCLEIADHDELFVCENGIRAFEKVQQYCAEVGTDWVDLIVFDGVHEFCRDDRPIERLIADLRKEA